MDLTNFSTVFHWVVMHGYIFIFLLMCLEGPMTTAAAAFGASLGYFSLPIIFVLSILGDIIPDTIYYYLGYGARKSVIDKYGHYFGLSQSRMERIVNLFAKNVTKTIVTLKLTPILPVPGFILIGSTRKSFLQFIMICIAVTLVKTTLFVILGYYFGQAYNISKYIKEGNYALIIIVVVFALIYYLYRKFSVWLAKRVEKI